MLFFTNKARETARENIAELYRKLASTKPTETLTLQDIESVMFYLREMDDELRREIKDNK